ncbi:MAG: NfeD family protein [Thermoprotei archaeon]
MNNEQKLLNKIIDRILIYGIRPLILVVTIILIGILILSIGISKSSMSMILISSIIILIGAILAIGFASTTVVKKKSVSHAPQNMIGQIGEAKSNIKPHSDGVVLVASELWSASSNSDEEIREGDKIIVTGHDGVKLIVKREKTLSERRLLPAHDRGQVSFILIVITPKIKYRSHSRPSGYEGNSN